MLNINHEILNSVVATALAAVQGDKRWTNAIKNAHALLIENPYIHAVDDHTLLIGSENGVYTANGQCQCVAFQKNKQPCKHRASARLWKRYNEALERQRVIVAQEQAQALIDELFDK